jgi:hypothetical protein
MDWTIWDQYPEGEKDFSLIQNVQTYSGAYPVFYSMGIEGLFCWWQAARG